MAAPYPWVDQLVRAGWLKHLTPTAVNTTLALGVFMNGHTREAWPDIARLTELTGRSETTVYDALGELQRFGLIQIGFKLRGRRQVRSYSLVTPIPVPPSESGKPDSPPLPTPESASTESEKPEPPVRFSPSKNGETPHQERGSDALSGQLNQSNENGNGDELASMSPEEARQMIKGLGNKLSLTRSHPPPKSELDMMLPVAHRWNQAIERAAKAKMATEKVTKDAVRALGQRFSLDDAGAEALLLRAADVFPEGSS